MKIQAANPTPPRLRRLFAAVLAAALLAALIVMGTGGAAAQEEERVDLGRIGQGKSLYRAWCRSCHGETATGDGPMAEYLLVVPSDLTLLSQKEGGRFYFGRVTAKIDGRERVRGHGSKDMPVWGEAFKVLEEYGGEEVARAKITAIVHFLRSIQVPADAESAVPDSD